MLAISVLPNKSLLKFKPYLVSIAVIIFANLKLGVKVFQLTPVVATFPTPPTDKL